MKIKEEYVLQHIAGKWVVMDTNTASVNFNKILGLNESGKLLWEKLCAGADEQALVAALTEKFGIDQTTAENDTQKFIHDLKDLGCIDDEG